MRHPDRVALLLVVALGSSCGFVAFGNPRWAEHAEMNVLVRQIRGPIGEDFINVNIVVTLDDENAFACPQVSDGTTLVVNDTLRELGESEIGGEGNALSCLDIGNELPLQMLTQPGPAATIGLRNETGQVVATVQHGAEGRTMTPPAGPVPAGTSVPLTWSAPGDLMVVTGVKATFGEELGEFWTGTYADGVVNVAVPAGTRPGTWTLILEAPKALAKVDACGAARCIVTMELVDVVATVEVTAP